MIIECPNCRSKYDVDRSRAAGPGKRARCYKCGTEFLIVSQEVERLSKLTEELNKDTDFGTTPKAPEAVTPPEESVIGDDTQTEFIEKTEEEVPPPVEDMEKEAAPPQEPDIIQSQYDIVPEPKESPAEDDWNVDDIFIGETLPTPPVDDIEVDITPKAPEESVIGDDTQTEFIEKTEEEVPPPVEDMEKEAAPPQEPDIIQSQYDIVPEPKESPAEDDWNVDDIFIGETLPTPPVEDREKEPEPPQELDIIQSQYAAVPESKESPEEDNWDMGDIFTEDTISISAAPVRTTEEKREDAPQLPSPEEIAAGYEGVDNFDRLAETSVPELEVKVAPAEQESGQDGWDIGDIFTEEIVSTTAPDERIWEEVKKPAPAPEPISEEEGGEEGKGAEKTSPKKSGRRRVTAIAVLVILALVVGGLAISKKYRQTAASHTAPRVEKPFSLRATIDGYRQQLVAIYNKARASKSAALRNESLIGSTTIAKRREQVSTDQPENEGDISPEGVPQGEDVSTAGREDLIQMDIAIPVYKNPAEAKILDMALTIEFTDNTVADLVRGNISSYQDSIKKSTDSFFGGKFYDEAHFVKEELAKHIMDDINKTLEAGQIKGIEIELLDGPSQEIIPEVKVDEKEGQ